jgi:hypothetical protein
LLGRPANRCSLAGNSRVTAGTGYALLPEVPHTIEHSKNRKAQNARVHI